MGSFEAGRKNYPGYFTTGDFADLCGIKRTTLIYYDKIGFFSPDTQDENGYRYYSLPQAMELEARLSLREMGMSLKDIETYMNSRSPELLIDLLRNISDNLNKKIIAIMNEKSYVDVKRDLTAEGLLNKKNEIILHQMPEEYCFISPYIKRNRVEWYTREALHDKQLRALNIKTAYPTGTMRKTYGTNIDDVHDFSFFQTKIREKPLNCDVFVKKAGTYIVIYHAEGYGKSREYHKKILEYAEEHHYTLDDYLFEDVIFDELTVFDDNDHTFKLSVRIK